ncbi:MAG: response regulator transcription factor [Rudanella sp.]|nr:response regulator transcription factor [Rudanella sp.]
MKSLLIVDDHRMFAEGIRFLLERSGEYVIPAILGKAQDVMPFLAHHSVQVLVLDIDLPDGSGIEIARLVRRLYPNMGAMGLSMLNDTHSINRMMDAGATGYCIKSAGYDELLNALRRVTTGKTYLPDSYFRQLQARQYGLDQVGLSEREAEIVQLISEGISTKQIADQLCLSPRTVETHRKNIYRKLNVHTNVELTHIARQRQLL